MRETFRVVSFKEDTREIVDKMNDVLSEYSGQKLSARQVYYRFIGDDLLPAGWVDVAYNRKHKLPDDTKNTEKNYKRLLSILSDARYAGLVDWDAIEDRGREPKVPGEWDSIDDIVDAAVEQFRLPRRADQPRHLELWVEKDALAGVLGPIARRWHVPLVVNKGYSSSSAMKAAADRMLAACGVARVELRCDGCGTRFANRNRLGKCSGCDAVTGAEPLYFDSGDDVIHVVLKDVVVLYLGDHDPSGEDMVRDVEDRLREFGVPNLRVVKVGLTMEQIRRFDPPPNPAKVSDPRAAAYVAKFGGRSWELDALPPRELNRIVDQAVAKYTDRKLLDAQVAREATERERVRAAIERSRKP